eukprot:CAMPEP_0174731672 /NCGR_PEP_ID=MMETSP1094-20130205/57963_1 /TAXON_ID=156173 /ORGANISM="Chrysochromulina brevifilum, Strain UTEX LB 985" /LENGTH=109 /DNA_ID=CAMNT_0015934085 /DNA_START=56 /DNA_END=382 /DNA_ORIENTATION=-
MPVDQRQIWTPRLTTSKFRAWSHKPKLEQTRVSTMQPPKRTPVSLDDSVTHNLLDKANEWLAQADALEKPRNDDGQALRDQIALLMFSIDVPKTIKEHEQEWDPKGDGT